MYALLERIWKWKYGFVIFNTKTTNSARVQEVFKIYHLQKLEGYKVQVFQARLQRLCLRPAKTRQATRRDEFQLQKRKSITCSSRRGNRCGRGLERKKAWEGSTAGLGGRSGAECERRQRWEVRRRRGRTENGRRCTGGTATDAGEPAIASQLAAATVPEAHPTRESLPRRGARGEAGRWRHLPSPSFSKREGGGKEAVIRRAPSRNSQTPRCAAWACPDKLGFSLASSLALRTLISLSFGAQVSPRTEAFGDVATWVWAAQADRTLVGDMLKIGGRQSWYFRHGF